MPPFIFYIGQTQKYINPNLGELVSEFEPYVKLTISDIESLDHLIRNHLHCTLFCCRKIKSDNNMCRTCTERKEEIFKLLAEFDKKLNIVMQNEGGN